MGNGLLPLTSSQLGVYWASDNSNIEEDYDARFLYRLEPTVDLVRLQSALKTVVEAHPSLKNRLTFDTHGDVCMIEGADDMFEVPIFEYEDIDAAMAQIMRPIELDGGPLSRLELYRTKNANYFLFDIHHILVDGVSTIILAQELSDAYAGAVVERETYTGADVARAELALHDTSAYIDAKAWYSGEFGGIDVDSVPLGDLPETENHDFKRVLIPLTVDESAVKSFCMGQGVCRSALYDTVFGIVLATYSGEEDAVFTTIWNGRQPQEANTVTMRVMTLPVHVGLAGKQTLALVNEIDAQIRNARKHSCYPFSEIAQDLGISTDISFVYQGEISEMVFRLDGYEYHPIDLRRHEPGMTLSFQLRKCGDEFMMMVTYPASRYSDALMEGIVDSFAQVLRQVLQGVELEKIGFVSPRQQQLMDQLNATECAYDHDATTLTLLRDAVSKYGDHLAVRYKDYACSYSEFDDLTDRLASYIVDAGVGRDEFVAVLIPRNEMMPITAWGVVKAGAAYQPLDPTYPVERLNFMVADSHARMLIVDRSLRPLLTDYHGPVLYTDEIQNLPSSSLPCGVPSVTPNNALVIIYTSGTTGTPKGCVLEHRNIVCFHHNHVRNMHIDASSHVASYASFGFDAGVMDVFTTLMAGASLYVVPDDIRLDLILLDEFFAQHAITHTFMTTQLGRMFAQFTKCPTLKHFLVGGEKLVPFTPPSDIHFVNGYGPSETIAYVNHFVVTDDSKLQPIGKPSCNIKQYVIDKCGRRLPMGACGELCIAGQQVGRGYLGRPEKTAEVFVDNPFCAESDYKRMYRTGDIVRLLPDGNYDFVGRRDGQVKIRGFRVELTEIDQIVRQYPSVKNATVQAYDDPAGGKFVAAFLVADEPIDADALKNFILEQKPPYMVPAVIMQIDQIPVNANGKVDKRKLPTPQKHAEKILTPQNQRQQQLLNIAQEVLAGDAIGVNTDLFAVGLTSIGCVKLNVRISEALGIDLKTKDIRTHSTIERLDAYIETLTPKHEEHSQPCDYPLTKTQEGLFVECMTHPDSIIYNIPFLLRIDKAVSVHRLREAVAAAVSAHPYLLTRLFYDPDGAPRLRRCDNAPFSADDVELVECDSIDAVKERLVRPFQLIENPLARFAVVEADSRYLFIDIHHIIADGTSFRILVADIAKAYQGEVPTVETYTGYDVSQEEQRARASDDFSHARDYYNDLLSGYECDFLPPANPETDPNHCGHIRINACKAHYGRVEKFCNENSVGINGFLCSVFGFQLAKWNGSNYSVFATIYDGRGDSRLHHTVSMLVKTLPLVVQSRTESPINLVRRTSSQLLDSMANDLYSFSEISRQLSISANVMFVYQGDGFAFDTFCGHPSTLLPVGLGEAKAPITLQVMVVERSFIYEVDYDPQRFNEAFISEFVRDFDAQIAHFLKTDTLEALPNPSGRKRAQVVRHDALPSPQSEAATDLERQICNIFADVLKTDHVFASDDFFAIGGSSISAVQVVVKCANAGINVVYKNLFENPTPQRLAQFLTQGAAADRTAPDADEKNSFDYSALEYNVVQNLPNISKGSVGNILLTGATGFLGSHVLKEYLSSTEGHAVCLVRKKDGLSAEKRLQMMMIYYFEDWFTETLAKRVTIVDADLGDAHLFELLQPYQFDTIINCAANVRHFAAGNSLTIDNLYGVQHLITLAHDRNALLVQTSSLSVCGESVNGSVPLDFVFCENHLNIGQSLENKYVHSKYLAEQSVIDAVSRGYIRAKIIRLGNLMARNADGEFQINTDNNGFLMQFLGYCKLGCYPVDMMDAEIEFSPIDSTARALLLLSATPDKFTVFHAKNCNTIHYGYFINVLRQKGHHIDLVESGEFESRFKQAISKSSDLSDFTGLLVYLNKVDASPTEAMQHTGQENTKIAVADKYEYRVHVNSGTTFTTKALYRLGFSWPLISQEYLENMVNLLSELEFF